MQMLVRMIVIGVVLLSFGVESAVARVESSSLQGGQVHGSSFITLASSEGVLPKVYCDNLPQDINTYSCDNITLWYTSSLSCDEIIISDTTTRETITSQYELISHMHGFDASTLIDPVDASRILLAYVDINKELYDTALVRLEERRDEQNKCWPKDTCLTDQTAEILYNLQQAKFDEDHYLYRDALIWLLGQQKNYDELHINITSSDDNNTCTITHNDESVVITTLDTDEHVAKDITPTETFDITVTCNESVSIKLYTVEEDTRTKIDTGKSDDFESFGDRGCWGEGIFCDVATTIYAVGVMGEDGNKDLAETWLSSAIETHTALTKYLSTSNSVGDTALYAQELSTDDNDLFLNWLSYRQQEDGSFEGKQENILANTYQALLAWKSHDSYDDSAVKAKEWILSQPPTYDAQHLLVLSEIVPQNRSWVHITPTPLICRDDHCSFTISNTGTVRTNLSMSLPGATLNRSSVTLDSGGSATVSVTLPSSSQICSLYQLRLWSSHENDPQEFLQVPVIKKMVQKEVEILYSELYDRTVYVGVHANDSYDCTVPELDHHLTVNTGKMHFAWGNSSEMPLTLSCHTDLPFSPTTIRKPISILYSNVSATITNLLSVPIKLTVMDNDRSDEEQIVGPKSSTTITYEDPLSVTLTVTDEEMRWTYKTTLDQKELLVIEASTSFVSLLVLGTLLTVLLSFSAYVTIQKKRNKPLPPLVASITENIQSRLRHSQESPSGNQTTSPAQMGKNEDKTPAADNQPPTTEKENANTAEPKNTADHQSTSTDSTAKPKAVSAATSQSPEEELQTQKNMLSIKEKIEQLLTK